MATSTLRVLIPVGVTILSCGLLVTRVLTVGSGAGGCGPTSLYALCCTLGVAVTPDGVFAKCGGDNPVSSFAELKKAAQELGLKADGRQTTLAQLRRTQPLGVLHVDGGHFVAVIGYTDAGLRVADPVARGRTSVGVWPYDQLTARWDGRILVVSR